VRLPAYAPVTVIGSGMSGCAVAGELARASVPAVVIEAGPNLGRDHVAASPDSLPLLSASSDPSFLAHAPTRAGAGHYGSRAGLRRRVGGRSLYWRGISLRIEKPALAAWPESIRNVLEGAGAAGLYEEVENTLEAWAGQALDVARSRREAALLERVRCVGFDEAVVTPRAVRVQANGCWSAYTPLLEVPPAWIHPNRTLVRVDSGPGDKLELVIRGRSGEERLRTGTMVLCSGTVENARLARQILSSCGVDSPRCYPVADHLVQGWIVARSVRYDGDEEGSVLASNHYASRSNVFIEVSQQRDLEFLDVWAMGEQLVSPSAIVRPEETGVVFEIALTAEDVEVLVRQREVLARVAEAMAVEPAAGFADEPVSFRAAVTSSQKQLGVAIPYSCPLGTLDHEAGTLALGGPVVDEGGRLRGVRQIFAAGPSLFPRCGAANPSLTTLATARYVARNVLQQT
jgi:choline dehydrogenase-like flavoprotein